MESFGQAPSSLDVFDRAEMPIVGDFYDDFYNNATEEEWAEFGLGFFFGTLLGVAAFFGHSYPCIGQISSGSWALIMLGYLPLDLLKREDDGFTEFAIGLYSWELYHAMSVNMCAKGLDYTPYIFEDYGEAYTYGMFSKQIW